MGSRTARIAGALAVLIACLGGDMTFAGPPKDEVVICDVAPSPSVMQANVTFNVIFTLDLDSEGCPTKIKAIRNDYLPNEPFERCFAQWALPAKNRQVAVVFRWQHGVGWTDLIISGLDINRKIVLRPPDSY